LAKNKLFKASYCRYLIGGTHILFFLYVILEKSLGFVFKEILITQTLCKPNKNHRNKREKVRFPIRTMHNSIVFISKLSSVTVGFLVKNGFGVP